MIMIGHFQLKFCCFMLFSPLLFCLWVGLCPGQPRAAPELQQWSSSTGARGIWLLAAVLTFALLCSCSIALHLLPQQNTAGQKMLAGDKVAFCWWQGTEPHDLSAWTAAVWHASHCRQRSECCSPPGPLQTAPTPWCSQSDSWTKWRLFLIYSCNLQWIILGWFINMKHVSKSILSVCHRWKN